MYVYKQYIYINYIYVYIYFLIFDLKKSKWETAKGRTEYKLSLRHGMKNKKYEKIMEYFSKDDFIVTIIFTKETFPGLKNEITGALEQKMVHNKQYSKIRNIFLFLMNISCLGGPGLLVIT